MGVYINICIYTERKMIGKLRLTSLLHIHNVKAQRVEISATSKTIELVVAANSAKVLTPPLKDSQLLQHYFP